MKEELEASKLEGNMQLKYPSFRVHLLFKHCSWPRTWPQVLEISRHLIHGWFPWFASLSNAHPINAHVEGRPSSASNAEDYIPHTPVLRGTQCMYAYYEDHTYQYLTIYFAGTCTDPTTYTCAPCQWVPRCFLIDF